MTGKFAIALALVAAMWAGAVDAQQPQRSSPAADPCAAPRVVGRTVDDSSTPCWPRLRMPPQGAPNVLLIMTDDVGFGASSTFGGPIPTPVLDTLAERGLRYSQFHTTGICSPTRASLMTGRNHNRVEMGGVIERSTAYEGYTSIMPRSAGALPRILRDAGYRTYALGKWHLTPSWESGPTGPYDRWPTGVGFERFYGFLPGDTNQWAPALYDGVTPVEYTRENTLLDTELADRAISWIRDGEAASPGRPFFMYLSLGTAHSPHHAPADWIERFHGQFDAGWDAMRDATLRRQIALGVVPANTRLSARPREIPAWRSLSSQQRRVFARQMEVYAAALAFADHEIGRVIAELQARGQLDNTLVIFIQGDNGASAEGGLNGGTNENIALNGLNEPISAMEARLADWGGPNTAPHFSFGWAHALNAPYPWVKQLSSHLGATRNGLVMSWPARIPQGQVRQQFHHVIDIMPTVLALTGVAPPDTIDGVPQISIDGVSMAYSFDNANAPGQRRTQMFRVWDNLAIYHDGWMASTTPHVFPWDLMSTAPARVNGRAWELYNLNTDPSQSRNIARRHPQQLARLQELFWAEAAANNALPIHRNEGVAGRPSWIAGRTTFEYRDGLTRLPSASAPNTINRSFRITALIDTSSEDTNGVIVTHGGRFGGYALYLERGRLRFSYNYAGMAITTIDGGPVRAGAGHRVELQFSYDGGGLGRGADVSLAIDGVDTGRGRLERTMPRFYSLDETFDVGADTGTGVIDAYPLTGKNFMLDVVTISVAER